MSIEENRAQMLAFDRQHPKDFLLIRSPSDVDKIDLMNSDMSDFFDFGDPRVIQIVQAALDAGKQVAVQGAGPDRVMIHAAKPGKKLFRFR